MPDQKKETGNKLTSGLVNALKKLLKNLSYPTTHVHTELYCSL